MVEEGVWLMVTLLGALIGLVRGSWLGVLRAPSERRDKTLVEVYKTLSLFYRSPIAWTGDPIRPPITEPETSPRDYCLKRYSDFLVHDQATSW